jgi:uncharacterized protein YeeX (DUF496 family)
MLRASWLLQKKNEAIQRQRRLRDTQRLNLLLAELITEFMNAVGIHVCISEAASVEITREDFEEAIQLDAIHAILEKLEIAYEDRLDLFDVLDADCSGLLSLGEILEGLKKLRGDPRRSDIIELGLAIRALQKRVHHDTQQLYTVVRKCLTEVGRMSTASGLLGRETTRNTVSQKPYISRVATSDHLLS